MANRRYSQEELSQMGCEVVKSLKPKGLLIIEIREILNHAIKALDYIPYGNYVVSEDEGQ